MYLLIILLLVFFLILVFTGSKLPACSSKHGTCWSLGKYCLKNPVLFITMPAFTMFSEYSRLHQSEALMSIRSDALTRNVPLLGCNSQSQCRSVARSCWKGGGGGVLLSNLSISQRPPPAPRRKLQIWAFRDYHSRVKGSARVPLTPRVRPCIIGCNVSRSVKYRCSTRCFALTVVRKAVHSLLRLSVLLVTCIPRFYLI